MSVLINMEMPESCYYCPFADGVWQKDKRCLINGKEMPRDGRDVQQNHINCPLIEIPPHGDLIDKDALLEDIDSNMIVTPSEDGSLVEVYGAEKILAHIAYAPTVIEKDGE